jgi:glycosyltransferase involved in cell wall biosynthesis
MSRWHLVDHSHARFDESVSVSLTETTTRSNIESIQTTGASPFARAQAIGDIAIVHDYLNQRGGAERVVAELADMWPSAPIYTSLYRPDSTYPGFKKCTIRTSFLDRLPVDAGFRNLFPLYVPAFRSLGRLQADVVICSSSGWSHMVSTSPDALRVVYCHTPARWLYRSEYLCGARRLAGSQIVAGSMFTALRWLDRRAAAMADVYVANSETVRKRIKSAYGIDAQVVPPPVDVDRFRPSPRGDRLLIVSRLLPYKHVELIVAAASKAGIGLDVVGDGPLMAQLRAGAGRTVCFHGSLEDASLTSLVEHARAVCVAAEEDFGIVAVEAQAAGKPVIAYGAGGSLESIVDGVTGVFFRERTVEAVVQAVKECDRLDTAPNVVADHARTFSATAFRARLLAIIESSLASRVRGRAVSA